MFNINDFKTSIDSLGVLLSNKYEVNFEAPKYIRDLNKYSNTKLMTIRCESVSIPGFDFASKDGPPRMGYGAIEKHPYVPGFSGISLTFLMDSKSEIYNFFYDWTMHIVNFNGKGGSNYRDSNNAWKPYEVGYKDDYKTDLNISVYDGVKKQNSNSSNEILSLKVYSAFPMGLPSIPLAWDSSQLIKLSIPFSYTDFELIKNNP
jgi:hypothetical protein